MRRPGLSYRLIPLALALAGCSTGTPASSGPASPAASATTATAATPEATEPVAAPTPGPSIAQPEARKVLFDTDVAGDDIVALTFLVAAPHVDLVAITVSGTGEAHCAGAVDVVLRLLERLEAPDIPVACGRETPLQGTHTFPGDWRSRVDSGSGLVLPSTDRRSSAMTAVELITAMAAEHESLTVLATGPLTNLAEAFGANPALAERLGPVVIMGGALRVPGNLTCCGAPEDNDVAEWNIYVDPTAAQRVVESGAMPSFVPLDGTNQVPITREFAQRAMANPSTPAQRVLADLFTANPFMTDGSFYLWDVLAAQVAAGYPVGSFSPARIVVEEAEGPEVGFTRPVDGEPNIEYLGTADAAVAHDTLLAVLAGG